MNLKNFFCLHLSSWDDWWFLSRFHENFYVVNVFLEANGCKKNYEKVRSVVKKCYVYGCVCILEWKLLFVSCIFVVNDIWLIS